jgi:hypothetical protein
MSDYFNQSNNYTATNNNSQRKNFQGSMPTTNYLLPATYRQRNIEFPKSTGFSQFTPVNSGITRDWSGSKMNLPEFKALNQLGKGLNRWANARLFSPQKDDDDDDDDGSTAASSSNAGLPNNPAPQPNQPINPNPPVQPQPPPPPPTPPPPRRGPLFNLMYFTKILT